MRLSAALPLVWLLGSPVSAWAQDTGSPVDVSGEGSAGAGASASAGGSASVGASGSASVSAPAASTSANGSTAGFGVGAMAMLAAPFGVASSAAAVVYDPGLFHIEGMLGFVSANGTDLFLGGRFFYHLHSSQAADFSVGGGLGYVSADAAGPMGEDESDILIEGGVELRLFIVPNVAINTVAGLAVASGDLDITQVTGQLLGDMGITYFF